MKKNLQKLLVNFYDSLELEVRCYEILEKDYLFFFNKIREKYQDFNDFIILKHKYNEISDDEAKELLDEIANYKIYLDKLSKLRMDIE